MAVLLDSNVWISFLYKKDPNYKKAEKVFEAIKERIILPEYVILEVATIISQKVGKRVANDFIENVINNQNIEILPSSQEFLKQVIDFYLSGRNKKLSFVDYSLLYLAKRIKVLTFDENLQKAIQTL